MTDKPPKKERFEDLLASVQNAVRDLESGALEGGGPGLEESIAKYEQAREALARCRAILAQLEKKIETLVRPPEGAAPPKRKDDG